jgi:hypothetical protein
MRPAPITPILGLVWAKAGEMTSKLAALSNARRVMRFMAVCLSGPSGTMTEDGNGAKRELRLGGG